MKYVITIDGRAVSYLKRVSYGAPLVIFSKEPTQGFLYEERAAKSWLKTLAKYFRQR